MTIKINNFFKVKNVYKMEFSVQFILSANENHASSRKPAPFYMLIYFFPLFYNFLNRMVLYHSANRKRN